MTENHNFSSQSFVSLKNFSPKREEIAVTGSSSSKKCHAKESSTFVLLKSTVRMGMKREGANSVIY